MELTFVEIFTRDVQPNYMIIKIIFLMINYKTKIILLINIINDKLLIFTFKELELANGIFTWNGLLSKYLTICWSFV